jgi:hypothetical protein
MAEVCITRNTTITDGVLGIAPWSVPRIVFDQTYNSTGDGAFTQLTTLPGKLMIDSGIQSWTNTSTLPAMVLLRVQRAMRNWVVSNPNAVQIRDRYTYAIDDDPRVPDTSSTYHGASGGSIDVGLAPNGATIAGKYWDYEDPTMFEDWLGPVEPGEQLRVWYRCYLWTPPPWSNNANNSSPEHSANVRNSRIQMMAFPTQDTAVIS